MGYFPSQLSFGLRPFRALVNVVMATHAQCSRQIVIGLYATAFAATPICVCRLDAYA